MNQTATQDSTGLYKVISALGTAVALAAAILITPAVFEFTYRPVLRYLAKTWGRDLAEILVWVVGAIEAYVIYASVSLLFTAGVIWAMTRLAMRGFRG